MSDTPRTNRIRKMLRMSREVVRPREDQLALLEGAENGIEELERELAAVTTERDAIHQRLITIGSICASGSDRPPGKAYSFEEWAEMLLAERDEAIAWIRVVGEEIAIAGHRSGDRAETLAGLRRLREERDRMRPVVEAAQNFRRPTKTFLALLDELNDAVDTYEAAK